MRVLVVAVCVALAAVSAAAAGAAAPEPCSRSAAVPARVVHGDDFEYVHSAASAMYCPSDVWVQITACVQVNGENGWTDVGCVTSDRAYVSVRTRGGRGVGFSFDVPCVSGELRTHVTGGEGRDPTEWDSPTARIGCFGAPPADMTPPQTTIGAGPSGVTNDASPAFSFSSSEPGSSFKCRLDGGPWTGCSSPAVYRSLAEGTHTFAVAATDPAGNADATPATRELTVDTTAPETTIDSVAPWTVAFSSEAGATFECRLDETPWDTCTSPVSVPSPPPGDHTFSVRAIDLAGNADQTPATLAFAAADPPSTTRDAAAAATLTPEPVPPVAAPVLTAAARDTTGPRLAVPRDRTVRASARGVVTLRIGAVDEDAAGTLRLRAAGRARTIACALRRGASTTLHVALPRAATASLRRHGSLSVRATLTLADAAGNAGVERFRLTVRPA